MIQLVCINAGVITKKDSTGVNFEYTGDRLTQNEVYTSPGISVDNDGHLCYLITELNDDAKLAERFIELDGAPEEICEESIADAV